ncbi:hypothetical protein BH20VER1_BH20VER1_11150 [soil metagenome]
MAKRAINWGYGLLKRKAGDKSFAEEWADYKREERTLEEAKYERCTCSHALLAYFRGESRGLEVRTLLDRAAIADGVLHMSDVNCPEVKDTLLKKDGAAAWHRAAEILQSLPIAFHSTSRALADSAADFKARFKISLADAFAAALAKEQEAELVTGDREFKALAKEIKIAWLKP